MKKELIILACCMAAFVSGAWCWHKNQYVQCPRCGNYVAKSKLRYVSEFNDMELACDSCGYYFLLTNKHISPDGTISSDIDPKVWKTDYEHYKNDH